MVEPNRHKRRRVLALRRQDHTDEEIDRLFDAVGGDPVLDARRTRQYVGDISDMTLWRWQEDPELAFPQPDLVIGNRRFWRLSAIESWLAVQGERSRATPPQPRVRRKRWDQLELAAPTAASGDVNT